MLWLFRQLGFQKIANQRRLHVRSNHGTADRLEQDEGEPAALDLLVLSHQRHQRVGVGEPFLGKSGDILHMGRQTDFGKMTADACGVGFGNHPELLQEHYVRYLHNGFREAWGFTGNPLRILLRRKAA